MPMKDFRKVQRENDISVISSLRDSDEVCTKDLKQIITNVKQYNLDLEII